MSDETETSVGGAVAVPLTSMPLGFPAIPAPPKLVEPVEPEPDPDFLDPFNAPAVPFVYFDPTDGKIRMCGKQSPGFTQEDIDLGAQHLVFGDGGEWIPDDGYPRYVDHDGADWVVRDRPAFPFTFDSLTLAPGQAATMADLPEAEVSFEGPIRGTHKHPGGEPLLIGWRVPGEYAVTIRSFPYLTGRITLTVRKP